MEYNTKSRLQLLLVIKSKGEKAGPNPKRLYKSKDKMTGPNSERLYSATMRGSRIYYEIHLFIHMIEGDLLKRIY